MLRIVQFLALVALTFTFTSDAQAQFDKLRKRLPGAGGNSEVESIILEIDRARVKSAYARVSLSLADDIIRRQALRNSAKKSSQGQIEKDQQEVAALDRSIAAKRKLVAELGRQSNSGKYDEKTAKEVDQQLKADEDQRAQKRAQVDEDLVDVALALLGRINAQLQLLTLAFPAKMLIALLLLSWISPMFPRILREIGGQAWTTAYRMLGI